jgi:MFS family permease
MARMPDGAMPGKVLRLDLAALLVRPFRDENFRRLMLFLGSWNFAVNLAAPFFTVYMLTRLGMDLTTVTVLTVLSQLANALVLREWGKIADRFSNKSVLSVCAPLFILCIFAWTFTTFPDRHAMTVPLLVGLHILTGVATAGVTLASTNIGLKLAPEGEATVYLASSSLVNSIAAGLAPVIGGLCADFFVNRELSLIIQWTAPGREVSVPALSVQHWDFFFVFATIIGAYSVHRLGLVREVGEVAERQVLNELLVDAKRTVRNLSSIAGLRAVTEFPMESLRRSLRRRRRQRGRRDARL